MALITPVYEPWAVLNGFCSGIAVFSLCSRRDHANYGRVACFPPPDGDWMVQWRSGRGQCRAIPLAMVSIDWVGGTWYLVMDRDWVPSMIVCLGLKVFARSGSLIIVLACFVYGLR